MAKPGRTLEELIARLEFLLGHASGIEVTSPDRIRGKASGGLREVDVSVRGRIGSAPVLLIFECRDRRSPEDVTWIEQLAKKREDVGADAAVAVCRKGFSEPARQAAAAYGVQLRTVEDLRSGDAFSWLGLTHLDVERRGYEVKDVTVLLPEDAPEAMEGTHAVRANAETPILRVKADGSEATIDNVWDDALAQAPDLRHAYESLAAGKTNGRMVALRIEYPEPENRYLFDMGLGPAAEVVGVELKAWIWVEREKVPLSRLQQYMSDDGTLVQVAEAEFVHEGKKVSVSFNHVPALGGTGVITTFEQ